MNESDLKELAAAADAAGLSQEWGSVLEELDRLRRSAEGWERDALMYAQNAERTAVWLSRDDARLALWKAIHKREFGSPTDDKLILEHLFQRGLWIGRIADAAPEVPR